MTPQLAEYFGLSKRRGALVIFVFPDSPAAKAGLKAGDVILSAGGDTVEDPVDLRRLLIAKPEGQLEIKVLRDKQEKTVRVQIEKGTKSVPLEPDQLGEADVKVGDGADGHPRSGDQDDPDGDPLPAIAAPMAIAVPKIVLAPMRFQMPKIMAAPPVSLVPIIDGPDGDEGPGGKTSSSSAALYEDKTCAYEVEAPKIKIPPVKIVVAPKRIVL